MMNRILSVLVLAVLMVPCAWSKDLDLDCISNANDEYYSLIRVCDYSFDWSECLEECYLGDSSDPPVVDGAYQHCTRQQAVCRQSADDEHQRCIKTAIENRLRQFLECKGYGQSPSWIGACAEAKQNAGRIMILMIPFEYLELNQASAGCDCELSSDGETWICETTMHHLIDEDPLFDSESESIQ